MKKDSQIKIVNHPRGDVSFGPFLGRAGLRQEGGCTVVAFPSSRRELQNVKVGLVDGKSVKVLSIVDSPSVKGMVLLTVEPVE